MKQALSRFFGACGVGLALCAVSVPAAVKLPAVFSDHMVLQREQPAPIWGEAQPGAKVTVKFRDQEQTATADAQGHWRVKLAPLTAGGPDKMTVSGDSTVEFNDVLVGEVWVGSGQSNMAGGAGQYAKNDDVLAAAVAAAPYARMRLARANKPWQEATPANVNGFSALLFYFGARLQKELDVPVGLLLGAVGGTPSGPWLSAEALKADPACQEAIKKHAPTFNYDEALKKYEQDLEKWKLAAAEAKEQQKRAPARPQPPAKPGQQVGHLYEAHIRPFVGYGIRGVLWDQGESGTAVSGVDQYTLMGALINGWRREWQQGAFPFIYIQKPSGGGCAWDGSNAVTRKAEAFAPLPPQTPNDGVYVETHVKIMTYPNTGMAISSDLGPGIHPVNKSGYAHRAADVALGMVYGRKVEYYGPVYASHKMDGDKVRVTFRHVGQGLACKSGDKLQGFAIAGADKVFQWADAQIDGDTVVLSCARVRQPAFVRYAWAGKRQWANLFNKDGLPAVPFRTDQ